MTDPKSIDDNFERRLAALHEELADTPIDHPSQTFRAHQHDEAMLEPAADVLRLIERVRSHQDTPGIDLDSSIADPQDASSSCRYSFDGDLQFGLPRTIGRFQVIRKLGEGGFGIVLLVHDPRLNRQVALKVPRPEALMTDELRTRFLREAEAAAALNHPNVVPVFEVGNVGPVAYIASLFVDGPTLAQLQNSRSDPFSMKETAELVSSLADAVQHAHSRGVLHRDIKTSNILIDQAASEEYRATESDTESISIPLARIARIADFGLAKRIDNNTGNTRTGSLVGTPSYMSPEQAEGNHDTVGTATDIYSLGAVLYELLAGRPPFQESTIVATLQAVQQQDPIPPRRFRPNVSADLESVCLKCLEKKPDSRYASAAALRADLQRFVDGEPVYARRITRVERFGRWCRRNPAISTLSLAVVLLAMFSSAAAILLQRSNREALANLNDAVASRKEATRTALNANIAHAHSVRRTGNAGHRVESWNALLAGMKKADEVGLTPSQRQFLRNEAIASLSLEDLVLDKQWLVNAGEDSFPAADADLTRYVRVHDGEVWLCEMDTGQVLMQLKLDEPTRRFIGFAFSDDGKMLAARYERRPGHERLHLWNLDSGETIGSVDVGGYGSAYRFTPDSDRLISPTRDSKALVIRQLPSLDPISTIEMPGLVEGLTLHPTEPVAACFIDAKGIEIRNLDSGKLLRTLIAGTYCYSMQWSPNGEFFSAVGRNGGISLYDGSVDPAVEPVSPIWSKEAHGSMVMTTAWHPDSTRFASSSMDGITHLWDADTGVRLVSADGMMTRFSRDGKYLGKTSGRWRFVSGGEHRLHRQPDAKVKRMQNFGLIKREGVTSEINHWEAFPRGRLVIGQNIHGATFRDVNRDAPLANVQLSSCGFRFNRDGTELIAVSFKSGFYRLPVTVDEENDSIEIGIGPPVKIVESIAGMPGMFAVAKDDRLLVSPIFGIPQMLDTTTGKLQRKYKPKHTMALWCDVSPTGRFVATGAFHGSDVQVHDADSGKLLKTLETGSACPWFSPDGRWLAIAELGQYSFVDTNSWEIVHEIQTTSRGIWPGGLAFTADGNVVAIEDGTRIRLLDTKQFASLAEFPLPTGEIVESIRFTPGGEYLIVGGADENPTHIWNLNKIRTRLRAINLDWDQITEPLLRQLDAEKPIRLKLDLGPLARTIH